MTTDHIELRSDLAHAITVRSETVRVSCLLFSELLAAYDALLAGATAKRGKKEYPADFLAAYDAMKEGGARWREGSTPAAAFKQWQARIKAGADAEQILEGVRRYSAYIAATAGEPKMAQTFFGPGEHYTAEWATRAPRLERYRDRAQTVVDTNSEALRRLDGIPPLDLNTIDMETVNGSR